MSNALGGLNTVSDSGSFRYKNDRADIPMWSFGDGQVRLGSGATSSNAAIWCADDSGSGAGMVFDAANNRGSFGYDAGASSFSVQFDSDKLCHFQGMFGSDMVYESTAMTAGQTVTYDNTTVANPKCGFLVIAAGAINTSYIVRGVALRSANDQVFVATHSVDNSSSVGTGEFVVQELTPNASNASAGFTIRAVNTIGSGGVGIYWEIRSADVVDTTGHTVA